MLKFMVSGLFLLFNLLLFPLSASAEKAINVLMMSDAYEKLPSEKARVIKKMDGKIFLNGNSYSGNLSVLRDERGFYVVNSLPFEKYVEGVVASEVSRDWELEALKAQAVVSRTYALYHKTVNGNKNYHLTSSILHQVYKGENKDFMISHAVKSTEDEILTYGGSPIKAFFHSNCIGKTELPEEIWSESSPYLKSVDCNSRNAPYENWQKTISIKELSDKTGTKNIKDIQISSYTSTGRVKTLKIISGADREIRTAELRKLLGFERLPSTSFSVSLNGTDVVFTGKGYGHGVGFCQWGALEMAKQGRTYQEILSHYFPGTALNNSKSLYYSNLTQ